MQITKQDKLHDFWNFDGALWTFVAGSYSGNDPTYSYGVLGIPSPLNYPPPRDYPGVWIDSEDNLYMMGGSFRESMNDLWKFNGTMWTWIGGHSYSMQPSIGVLGQKSLAFSPGARYSMSTWTDANDNLWLYGGFGLTVGNIEELMNDLWVFDGEAWGWIAGSDRGPDLEFQIRNYPGHRRTASFAGNQRNNEYFLFGGSATVFVDIVRK